MQTPTGGPAAERRVWIAWAAVFAPVLLAAAAYVALRPPSVDLAAQLFRAELFDSHGFLTWNNYWYGGHYLPGYSLVFPPLGATIGAATTGGLAALAATGFFGALARRHYGAHARLATLWFGAGTISMLLSGRLTFVLGVAIGMAALLLLDRRHPLPAAALAAAAALASPVAGFFLALVGLTLALSGERRRGAVLATAAAAPILVMALAFPIGGEEPYVVSSAAGTLAVSALVLALLPRRERLLRRGVAVYAAATVAVFAIPNALGGNIARLSNIAAGALLALALTGPRRRLLLILVAAPLLYWQWQGAVRDVSRATADPSVERSFYVPLLAALEDRAGGAPVRIEIPPTRDRWEAYHVSPGFLLARGWLRQLETGEADLFRSDLSARSYRRWLLANGVEYVALPRAPLDYLSRREAEVIRAGPSYLKPIWRNAEWRLYEVRNPTRLVQPLGQGEATVRSVTADGFLLDVTRPGRFLVRVAFTPYWSIAHGQGCLVRRGEWTVARVNRPGAFRVAADFSIPRAWNAVTGAKKTC